MKELFRKLQAAEKEMILWDKKLDLLIEQGKSDEQIEKIWEEKYKIEFDLFCALAKKISEVSKGKITEKEARRMLRIEREAIEKIMV